MKKTKDELTIQNNMVRDVAGTGMKIDRPPPGLTMEISGNQVERIRAGGTGISFDVPPNKPTEERWDQRPWGKLLLGIAVALIAAAILGLFRYF